MATHSSILAWKIPDRGAWCATVRSSASVREALLAQGASTVAHVQPKVSARAMRRAEAMRDTLGVDGTTEL